MLSDAVGSVGVIIAALALELFGWAWIDPVVAAAIGLWILPRTWRLGRQAVHILMQSAPARVDLVRLRGELAAISGVVDVHDLHVWTLTSDMDAASAHLVTADGVDPHGVLDSARGRCSPTSTGSATARSRSNPSATPAAPRSIGRTAAMASYTVNKAAVEHAKRLIDNRQYVLNSEWGDVQPNAEAQNRYLEKHSWDEYACWHLGLTEGAADETKARYAFVYGDLRRVHRTGLIACVYRASEWRHKAVELAAHDLLQRLDAASGLTHTGGLPRLRPAEISRPPWWSWPHPRA